MTLTPHVRDLVASVHADTPFYVAQHLGEAPQQPGSTPCSGGGGPSLPPSGPPPSSLPRWGSTASWPSRCAAAPAELGIRMAAGRAACPAGPGPCILRQGFHQIGIGLVTAWGAGPPLGGPLGSFLFQSAAPTPCPPGHGGLLLLTRMLASILPGDPGHPGSPPLVALRS